MLIAASHSHEISADLLDSASAVPQQSGSPVSQGVSLFDLLLSQVVATSYQANPAAPNDKTSASDLTSQSLATKNSIPHLAKQKSTSAADSVAINPLTNLLFLSNGPAIQKAVKQSNQTTGLGVDRGNVAKLSTEPKQLASIATTLRPARTASADALTGRSTGKSTLNSGNPQSNTADPTATEDSTTAKSQINQSLRMFAPAAVGQSPDLVTSPQANLGQKRFETALVTPESTSLNFATDSSGALATFQASSIADVQSISVESKPAAVDPIHVATSIQHPASPTNDTIVPIVATSTASNIEHEQSSESVPSVSEQLATAITANLSTVMGDGSTTVRIRLDRQDLGTINLHLSINQNVVSVRIMTDNSQAQQVVDSQMSALRQSLTVGGVECGQFQVGCDSNNRPFTSQKSTGRSTESLTTSRGTMSGTLKFPVARNNDRVSFVA